MFQMACADQAETDKLWAALTANGGSEVACGWLNDPLGRLLASDTDPTDELIKDPDRGHARRVMEAMMIKIDIATVEQAADRPK